MKRIVKLIVLGVVVGSLSGCMTIAAEQECPALVPLAVPADFITSPIQMAWLLYAM